LGQFGFKGTVAHWIGKNISGTGTQLQHFLGSILASKQLEKYFDKVHFKNIHIAETVTIESQKHIFVFAFLGLILENAGKKQLERFIFNEFILPNDHLLPQTYIHKNQWIQLKFLCKQHFDAQPKIKEITLENEINQISVSLNEQELAACSSVSYKYARKKAIAMSLKIIANKLQTQMENDALYKKNESLKLAQLQEQQNLEKEKIQQIHQLRNDAHSKKMELRRKQKDIDAQLEDQKRRVKKQ